MLFRGKSILFPIMGLVLLISAGTVLPSYFHQNRLIKDAFKASEYKQTRHITHTTKAILASEVDKIRALGSMVETLDPLHQAISRAPRGPIQMARLTALLDRITPSLEANIFKVTDARGNLLHGSQNEESPGQNLPFEAVNLALSGTSVVTLHESDSGSSIVSVTPARYLGNIVGTIIVGQKVDEAFTQKIADTLSWEVTFCNEDSILNSTLDDQEKSLIDWTTIRTVLGQREPQRLVTREGTRAIHYNLVDLADKTRCLVLVADISEEAALLAAKQKRSAVTGGLVLVGALGFGFLFTLWFTRPIRGLIDAASKMTLEITGRELTVADSDGVQGLDRTFARMRTAIQQHQDQARRDSEDIRQKNEEWRSLVQNAPDIIIKLDRKLTIRYMNRETHGVKPFEVLGQDILGFFHPDSRPGQLEAYRKVLETGEPRQIEGLTCLPDGSQNWYDTRIAPIIKDGQVEAMLQISQDITSRKKAQQELQEAKLLAEQANHSKSIFLANMSHEIRTPLTSILGFASLLEDPSITADEKVDFIRTIKHNGDHLLRIINDILDLSKIEAGQMEAEKEPVELIPMIEEGLDLMAVRARERGISLERDLHYPLPNRILGDKLRLQQILVNLVGNAIKFTEEGSVTLSLKYRNPGPEGVVAIAVTDTGIGMTDQEIQRLFTPFTQAGASTSRRFGGSGLGLAISRSLAHLMGGTIEVTSQPDQGSTFTLTLCAPTLDQADLIQAAEDPVPSVSSAKLRNTEKEILHGKILVAEDNPFNLRLATILLTRFGLTVKAAQNGLEACAQAKEAADSGQPFDLILMDMMMPVMDGMEATRTLRKRGFDLPIIAFTANALQEDREICLQAGCDDVAIKPVNKETLLATLKRHLLVDSLS